MPKFCARPTRPSAHTLRPVVRGIGALHLQRRGSTLPCSGGAPDSRHCRRSWIGSGQGVGREADCGSHKRVGTRAWRGMAGLIVALTVVPSLTRQHGEAATQPVRASVIDRYSPDPTLVRVGRLVTRVHDRRQASSAERSTFRSRDRRPHHVDSPARCAAGARIIGTGVSPSAPSSRRLAGIILHYTARTRPRNGSASALPWRPTSTVPTATARGAPAHVPTRSRRIDRRVAVHRRERHDMVDLEVGRQRHRAHARRLFAAADR